MLVLDAKLYRAESNEPSEPCPIPGIPPPQVASLRSELNAERNLGSSLQEQLSLQLTRSQELAASEARLRDALARKRGAAAASNSREVEALREDLAAASKRLDAASVAEARLAAQLASSDRERRELRTKLATAADEVAAMRAELATLRGKLGTLEERSALEAQLAAARAETAQARLEGTGVKTACAALQDALATTAGFLTAERLAHLLAVSDGQPAPVLAPGGTFAEAIASLRDVPAAAAAAAIAVPGRLKDALALLAAVQERNSSAYRSQLEASVQRLDGAMGKVADLTRQLEERTVQLVAAKAEATAAAQEAAASSRRIATLEGAAADKASEVESLHGQLVKAIELAETAHDEIERYKVAADRQAIAAQETAAAVANMEARLAALQALASGLEQLLPAPGGSPPQALLQGVAELSQALQRAEMRFQQEQAAAAMLANDQAATQRRLEAVTVEAERRELELVHCGAALDAARAEGAACEAAWRRLAEELHEAVTHTVREVKGLSGAAGLAAQDALAALDRKATALAGAASGGPKAMSAVADERVAMFMASFLTPLLVRSHEEGAAAAAAAAAADAAAKEARQAMAATAAQLKAALRGQTDAGDASPRRSGQPSAGLLSKYLTQQQVRRHSYGGCNLLRAPFTFIMVWAAALMPPYWLLQTLDYFARNVFKHLSRRMSSRAIWSRVLITLIYCCTPQALVEEGLEGDVRAGLQHAAAIAAACVHELAARLEAAEAKGEELQEQVRCLNHVLQLSALSQLVQLASIWEYTACTAVLLAGVLGGLIGRKPTPSRVAACIAGDQAAARAGERARQRQAAVQQAEGECGAAGAAGAERRPGRAGGGACGAGAEPGEE